MNVELLRKVEEKILAEPSRFDMSTFVDRGVCGTTYCIGGWAATLSGKEVSNKYHKDDSKDPGQEELGLTDEEADRLFYTNCWPEEFLPEGWQETDDDVSESITARQAVDRIEHFIATEGRE
jgi:hypothetical protein